MVTLKEITRFCDNYLDIDSFSDYCPNGLQVEAGVNVKHIATAVTASLATIEAAVDAGADILLVHHGYFWKGESPRITGMKGKRIRTLIENEISLLAYHLPLDAHPQTGNNVQLARRLGWANPASVDGGLLWQVELDQPETADSLLQNLSASLEREALHIPGGPARFTRVGWCTGAAQSYIEQAAELGLQAFISGEISEHTTHAARELGIHYFAAGHHATERYGIQALGKLLTEKFDVSQRYIEIFNPV